MTISTTASIAILQGNGATTAFDFNFIAASAEDIQVIYTDADGAQTTLLSSQYTLVIKPPATGQIWGVGGTVTYPLVGSPIDSGTSLTIQRIKPYTQVITISNQGDFAPQVIEEMGDTLEMQIQQVAARTGQLRGTWVTDTSYTFGDVVVDGANGLNTGNFYMCAIGNTSDVWEDDLAAGYWNLAITAQIPSATLPLSIANGGTGNTTGQAVTALTLATARTINGVEFDGSANITVPAAAGTLTGTTIGSTVITSYLTTVGTVTSGTWSAGPVTTIGTITGGSLVPTANSATNGLFLAAANTPAFASNSQDRGRILSTGPWVFNGTTTPNASNSGTLIGNPRTTSPNMSSVGDTATSTPIWQWFNINGQVGSISIAATTTTYATSSDERLKENIEDYEDGLTVIRSLRPVAFNWKSTKQRDIGFIAHEVGDVIPSACAGKRNAVDSNGNIIPQGVDASFIVAHLVSAVQDLSKQIDDIKEQIKE